MSEVIAEVEAGSVPLVPLKYEIYARERALCASMETAAQRAGYAPRCGKSSKLERDPAVQARIAFLARDDAELLKEKRRQIEARLCAAAFSDLMECADIDDDGKLVAIDWRKVRASPIGATISEFAFDAKSGELTRFKRDNPLEALSQLRDMHGFKAPAKSELTGPQGSPLQVQSITRVIVEPGNRNGEDIPAVT